MRDYDNEDTNMIDIFHAYLIAAAAGAVLVRLVLLVMEMLVISQVFNTQVSVRGIQEEVTTARALTPEAKKKLINAECTSLQKLLDGQVVRMGTVDSKAFDEAKGCHTWPAYLQLSLQLQTLRWSWHEYIGIDQVTEVGLVGEGRLYPWREIVEAGILPSRSRRLRGDSTPRERAAKGRPALKRANSSPNSASVSSMPP